MRHLLITLVLLTTVCSAQEKWHALDGPQDGDVDIIERDSSGTLYAGMKGDRTLYSSSDNGRTWKGSDPGGSIHSLAIDRGGNLYLSLADAQNSTSPIKGLVYSNDRGATWTILKAAVPNARIVSVAPDGSVFFSTHSVLTRRRADDTVWRTVSVVAQAPANPANQIQRMVYHPDGDLFAGTFAGVYRTTNSGDSWTRISTGLGDSIIRELAIVGGDLYAGGDSALWRSSDRGVSWSRVDIEGDSPVILPASSPERVMVGTRDGTLYRSSDRGATWRKTTTPNLFIRALRRADDGVIVAGSVLYGAYLSSDEGETWTRSVRGMNSAQVSTLAIAPDGTMFAGLLGLYGGMIYTSTDGGSNWQGIRPDPAPAWVWCSAALGNGDALMGTEGTGIYRSTDRGASWRQSNTGLTNLIICSLAVRPNGNVLAGTEGKGLFISRDSGRTWAPTTLATRQVWAIAIHPDGTILAGLDGAIRYSTDGGDTWNPATPSAFTTDIQAFTVAADSSIYAATFQRGVYRSSDAGRTWAQTSYLQEPLFAAAALPSGEVFVGGYRGVVRTTDNGVTWDTVGGSFSPWADWLTVDSSGHLFASAGRIYRLERSTGSVVDRRIAKNETVISIAPNPVTAGATVHLSLKQGGAIRLRVYDLRGRLRGTLLERSLPAGEHDVPWMEGLEAGEYVCVLNGAVAMRVEVR